MAVPFRTFGPVHLGIVLAVPAVGGLLAGWMRRRPGSARAIRLALASGIAVNELVWFGYTVARGWFRPPEGLPLDLCDVLIWLTVYALVTLRPWALEVAYFLGIAGSGMAVLTPDVGGAFPTYPSVKFFLSHGAVVAATLALAWSGALRPRAGAWWRVFLALNAYAALVASFNFAFGTNYMYLRQKPQAATLLDYLGPWPWYVLAAEPVALGLLALLDLPFRGERRRRRSAAPPP